MSDREAAMSDREAATSRRSAAGARVPTARSGNGTSFAVSMSDELLGGYQVCDDDDDDTVLLKRDGSPVDTWREDYPYDERVPRADYDHAERLLQIELLKLQNWVRDTGERLVILFEGRDAARSGSQATVGHRR